MKKVENIQDVYDVLNSCEVNRYVGTHPQDIVETEWPEYLKEIPVVYSHLFAIIGDDGFLAGGAVRALLTGTNDARDFDIYSYTPEGRERLLKKFLADGFIATYYNFNCVMLHGKVLDSANQVAVEVDIQIIFSFVGSILQVLDEFDFTVCRVGTDGKKIYKDKDFEHNVDHKLIRIKTIQCPISAVRRIIKYTKKGFFITNFQIFKLYQDFMRKPNEYQVQLEKLLTEQEDGTITKDELLELYEILKKVD